MITFKQYLEEKWKHYEADVGRDIGPHEKHEYDLMKAGKKPVALPDFIEAEKFEPEVKAGNFIKHEFTYGPEHVRKGTLYALPHERKRMEMLAKEFGKPYRNHAKIGILLGYTKNHIRKFTDR